MSDLDFQISGGKGKDSGITRAHVDAFETTSGRHSGLVTLTHPFVQTEPSTKFFQNPTKGIAMNQVITFGGTGLNATVVHAGVNSGNAIAGTTDVASPAAFELDDSAGGFDAAVGPGALVHNTSLDTYAIVTAVNSDTNLTLDTDIMQAGNETFTINLIWPGTAVAGTWNFADSGKITITSANNDDEATFNVDAASIWNASHFVSFRGKVDLDVYNPQQNTISLEFGLDGTLVGNPVNLDDFIDTGDFTEQSFVIPKDSFGLSAENFNSMRIVISRAGGTRPTIKFDDLQWENTGTPLVYSPTIARGEIFHVEELVFTYKDNIDSLITVLTTEQATAKLLDPDAILGLASLTNGFIITRKKGSETLFSATIHNLGSHMAAGAEITELITAPDGSSTQVIMRARFKRDLVLTGAPDDTITIQINDDMSGLERFTVAARGGLEVSE